MLKGAIFDFDGTLFDSMFIWDTAGETYLRSLGRELEADLRKTLKPMSLRQSAEYLRARYGLALSYEEICDGVNRTVEDFYFHKAQPKPGVIDLLKELRRRKMKMCVATASDRYQAEAALSRCAMGHYFDGLLTCTEVGSGKDEPFIYRKAMEKLGAARHDTVVFEDAYHGALTAKTDGFWVAGVYDAHETNQQGMRRLCDVYLRDFADLTALWKFVSRL